jgi:hypothetical protein
VSNCPATSTYPDVNPLIPAPSAGNVNNYGPVPGAVVTINGKIYSEAMCYSGTNSSFRFGYGYRQSGRQRRNKGADIYGEFIVDIIGLYAGSAIYTATNSVNILCQVGIWR